MSNYNHLIVTSNPAQTVPANKVTVQAQTKTKVSVQDFLKQGRYLIDEVKRRAEKGSPFFFTPETMRFFSSRVSELAWSKGDYQTEDIYFITSERDTSFHKHSGSTRGYTVRLCDKTGDIQKVSEFQEFGTLSQARKSIKEVLEK